MQRMADGQTLQGWDKLMSVAVEFPELRPSRLAHAQGAAQ